MTIAIGALCREGFVIAADSQISVPGYYKFHESKVHLTDGPGFDLIFSYSDDPALYQEARDKIVTQFRSSDLTPLALRTTCEEVFLEMGGLHVDRLNLEMLIGVRCQISELRILVFDGRSLNWATGIHCLGSGDSSLTRWLSETLYEPTMTADHVVRTVVYIISKAKSYIDHCGGETTIYKVCGLERPTRILPDEVERIEFDVLARERYGLRAIVGL
ncbi:MAG: hypothetical protein ACRD2B_10275 [Terriglobia bacterium]